MQIFSLNASKMYSLKNLPIIKMWKTLNWEIKTDVISSSIFLLRKNSYHGLH